MLGPIFHREILIMSCKKKIRLFFFISVNLNLLLFLWILFFLFFVWELRVISEFLFRYRKFPHFSGLLSLSLIEFYKTSGFFKNSPPISRISLRNINFFLKGFSFSLLVLAFLICIENWKFYNFFLLPWPIVGCWGNLRIDTRVFWTFFNPANFFSFLKDSAIFYKFPKPS